MLRQDQRVMLSGDGAESMDPDSQRLFVLPILSEVDHHGKPVLLGRHGFKLPHRVWIHETTCFQLSVDLDLESFTVSCTNRDGGRMGSLIRACEKDLKGPHEVSSVCTHPRPLCTETISFGGSSFSTLASQEDVLTADTVTHRNRPRYSFSKANLLERQ